MRPIHALNLAIRHSGHLHPKSEPRVQIGTEQKVKIISEMNSVRTDEMRLNLNSAHGPGDCPKCANVFTLKMTGNRLTFSLSGI